MSLDGINKTIKNLEDMGLVINTNVKSTLIDKSREMELRAKQILGEKALRHYIQTGRTYWTGNLQKNIETEIVADEKTVTGTAVGVSKAIKYAEWVEIGHRIMQWHSKTNPKNFTGSGAWWEGYHYLESAYLEVAPTISSKITDTVQVILSNFSRKGGRTRSKATGKFTRGNFSIN